MTTRKQYYDALDRLEGQVEQAFLDSVRDAVDRVSFAELEAAVATQSIERILIAAGVSAAVASMTAEAVRAAFVAGGVMESVYIRTAFNIRSPRAEAWLAKKSSELVTMIVDSQREAIREVLTTSMELGRGPRQTALDIVGRMDRATGHRSGGVVGLSGPQGAYVANARKELMTLDKNYFTRSRRDHRFDSVVMRAIKNETPLSGADIDRIVGRYADRLLQTRGEAIASTETTGALNAGREEALQQAIDSGDVHPQFVTRTWDARSDSRTRTAHAHMNGQKRPAGQPFQSPTGSLMMFPGDTSLGARAEDIINCRCFESIAIDYIGIAAARARG